MDLLLPIITGVLYSAGLYLMLHRSFMKLILGIIVMGHATNLFLFVISRLSKVPALLTDKDNTLAEIADPVPQALILTAIVIGFGIQAFAMVLLKRAYQTKGTDDLDDLTNTDTVRNRNKHLIN